eukprot:CAMPEP_0204907420 /NCGR_PEP_ID=MMETSP1397-20131031/6573_1 /ASSEMBLY_ACC=CAM_ASM_000891 /TAXON_ID=49980 /ORGANISM="Climacostomum Climacostomum virens, Strain Stock W-24" /LENGTH=206 /DNA_ID=CAMNT_0052076567 /DNA_START=1 /DNA_END=621 /DNA_ORIENTATION=-
MPDTFPDYSSVAYWNSRYEAEGDVSYDWLLSYAQLRSVIVPRLPNKQAEILILGCGNSSLSEELYNEGYLCISNVDFSPVVIQRMSDRYQHFETMEFAVMDAQNLEFPDNCFNLVVDKGTLDCILCNENSFAKALTVLRNVHRVLAPGGIYILVSYGVPDTRVGYLKNRQFSWKVEHARIAKFPLDSFDAMEASPYNFVYVCTKPG